LGVFRVISISLALWSSALVARPECTLVSLLRLARQPDNAFIEKTNQQVLEIARAALFAPRELSGIDIATLPPDLLTPVSRLREAFPWLKAGPKLSPMVEKGFQNQALQADLARLSAAAARYLHDHATPTEKVAMTRAILGDLRQHDAREYSQSKLDWLVNQIVGVRIAEVTRELQQQDAGHIREQYGPEETYFEHGATNLLTRYRLAQDILDHLALPSGSKVVDIGSGFGNLGTYIGIMRPDLDFAGYELVRERVEEAKRIASSLALKDVTYHQQNLADPGFQLPPADVYYAFNPVSDGTFDKILLDLKRNARRTGRRFRLVVTGPAPIHKVVAQRWLKEVTPAKPFEGDVEVQIFEFDPSDPARLAAAKESP